MATKKDTEKIERKDIPGPTWSQGGFPRHTCSENAIPVHQRTSKDKSEPEDEVLLNEPE